MSLKNISLGSVASAARGILITSGTNATPIVATVTAGHKLKNGDGLAIMGVTTLTNMNGEFTLSSVGATSATLLQRPNSAGAVGNGAFGGTAVVAALCDRSPHLRRHAAVAIIGNTPGAAVFVGTVVLEFADAQDFVNNQFTNTVAGVATAGFGSSLLSGEAAIPAASAGIGYTVEVQLERYMTFRCSAYTSGGANCQLLA
jgi:hypothetical protein